MPCRPNAARDFLAGSRDIIHAIDTGEVIPQHYVVDHEFFVVVVSHRHAKQVLHQPGELTTYLRIPVGKLDLVSCRHGPFRDEITKKNGLVLAESVTSSRFLRAEERRDEHVSWSDPARLSPPDQAPITHPSHPALSQTPT